MADAQYVIDIAASMPAGEQTIAQLDALTAELTGAGKGAAFFSDAVVQVTSELTAASAASTAANAALSAGQAEYRILEKAANQAAKAAERAARANQGVVPAELAAASASAAHAVDAQAKAMAHLEASARAAAAEETRLSATLQNVKKLSSHTEKTIGGQAEAYERLRGGLDAAGGPLGKLASRVLAPAQGFSKLASGIGVARAAALVSVGAFAAVGVAAIAGTAAIAAWATSLADARRTAGLTRAAAEAMTPSLAALHDQLDAIEASTGVSVDALAKYERQLRAARVAAADMPAALHAIATAEAALGAEGASDWIANLQSGKRGVRELAADTEAKLGGIVAKRMMSLDAQSARFSKRISDLFGRLNIEPVLEGMQTLVSLFDRSTVAGEAMATLFDGVFQPIIDGAKSAAVVIEAFALGALIGMTRVYIAVRPAIDAIGELLGFEDTSLTAVLAGLTKAAEYGVYVFAGLAAILTGGVAVALAGVTAIMAPLVALTVMVVDAFGAIGRAIVEGITHGFAAGAGALKDSIVSTLSGAVTAAKVFLGIHSPSALLYDTVGSPMVEGVATSLDDGDERVDSALRQMVEPPADVAASAGASAPASAPVAAPAAAPVALPPMTMIFNGVKDAEHADALFAATLTRILEGDVAALGGAVAA